MRKLNSVRLSAGLVMSVSVLSAACYPTLPPHLAEGTEVLAPGRVNVTLAGGAGASEIKNNAGTYDNEFGAGFEARLRTGLGYHQELGLSVVGGMGTAVQNGDPPFMLGGKLSYKIAPLPWLAFVVDGGAMVFRISATAVFSADVAAIVAPYTRPNGDQLYVGLKGAFAVPVLVSATNVNEAIVIPIGYSMHTSKNVKLILEGGPIAGFAQQSNNANATNSFGGYAIVAFTFQLR